MFCDMQPDMQPVSLNLPQTTPILAPCIGHVCKIAFGSVLNFDHFFNILCICCDIAEKNGLIFFVIWLYATFD